MLEDVRDESCGGRCGGRTGTRLGRQSRDNKRYDIFPCWVNYSSLVWFGVASDRWASHWSILVLPRVFQAIEQQAFLRVIALSRIDLNRERFLVLPRLFALHHWPLPPLWDSRISAESPFRPSSNLFWSACA